MRRKVIFGSLALCLYPFAFAGVEVSTDTVGSAARVIVVETKGSSASSVMFLCGLGNESVGANLITNGRIDPLPSTENRARLRVQVGSGQKRVFEGSLTTKNGLNSVALDPTDAIADIWVDAVNLGGTLYFRDLTSGGLHSVSLDGAEYKLRATVQRCLDAYAG